ncbi:MAG: hypothetical protein RLZZ618_3081 [Pseudomonadota bacterium]|jgi:hypothetical protein
MKTLPVSVPSTSLQPSIRPGGRTSALISAALVLGLLAAPPAGAASDLCAGLLTDKDDHPMPRGPKPAKGQTYVDPVFKTRVTRITDVEAETGKPGVRKPLYSTVPAWNADESLLILYQTAGYSNSGLPSGHLLYDGKTYKFLRQLSFTPADLEHVYWDTTDPDSFYYPSNYDAAGKLSPQLIRFHVSSGTKEVVHTFPPCPLMNGKFDYGHPKFMSWNGEVIGLRCADKYPKGITTAFNIRSRTATPWVPFSDNAGVQIAPSGKLGVRGPEVVDPLKGLAVVRPLKSKWDEHATLAPLANGHDALVSSQYDVKPFGNLVVENLNTGAVSVVIGPDKGHGYPRTGSHVSAVALRNPGWVAVSMVGKPEGRKYLDQELALGNINTGAVCRVAHHHSQGRDSPQKYWAEPHVTISPSGTRMVFASDWHGSSSVDTYVVELPAKVP